MFDLDPAQQETQPRRVLGRGDVLESIRTELSRLLNTRCADTIDHLAEQARTVINFGLPDFLTLSASREVDRQRLARLVADAVRAYEPRLRAPVVEVVLRPDRSSSLLLILYATLELDHLVEPVSFPLVIEERGGAVLVSTGPDEGPAGSD